jgi:hypothetical protein
VMKNQTVQNVPRKLLTMLAMARPTIQAQTTNMRAASRLNRTRRSGFRGTPPSLGGQRNPRARLSVCDSRASIVRLA